MKKFLLFFFVLSALSGAAQKYAQARVDSLLAELPHASDQQKITIYTQLMTTYNAFDREAALKLEQPATELAAKIGAASVAMGEVKSAVGRIYWRERKYAIALKYHTEARQLFERANDVSKIALTVRYLGQDYADSGNYPEALSHFSNALALYTELGDKRNMAYLHELFSWVHDKQGDYLKASQSSYAALSLFEEMNAQNEAAIAAAAVADSYIHLGNYKEALKLFRQSAKVYKAKSDLLNLGYNHLLIGKVHRLMGMYAEAKESYDSALHIGEQFHDITIAASSYQGLADVYLAQQDNRHALAHYLSAADLFHQAGNKSDLARVYCSVGECYRIAGQFDSARTYYQQALALSQQISSKTLLADYYRGMEKLDSTMGNWKGAYQSYKEFVFHRDSVFNQDHIRKMVQLQLQHEFDKKEAAARLAQHEKDIRQQRQFLFLGIIIVLIFMLALVFYRNQKRIARINQELKVKSESLEEENREKESILKIVSHDLRSPFNKIKGLADLLQLEKELPEKDRELYFSYIQTSIDQGNYLIQHLLDAQSIEHSAGTATIQDIDITKFIQDFEQVAQQQLQRKQQVLHTDVQLKNNKIATDPQLLTRILDNLVGNASKFSVFGKPIYLRVWSEESHLFFAVRDEGPGISEEDQKKLFRKFQKLSARPTAGENSTGLGLSITKALVEKLNGTIAVQSTIGTGTEMVIRLRMDV